MTTNEVTIINHLKQHPATEFGSDAYFLFGGEYSYYAVPPPNTSPPGRTYLLAYLKQMVAKKLLIRLRDATPFGPAVYRVL